MGNFPRSFRKLPRRARRPAAMQSLPSRVPDLTIRQPKKDAASETPMKTILYSETVRSVSVSTLSVPLRPANRMIPRSLDARFQGRNVYTMAVPIENMPAYDGDWIMWFADQESKPGETPLIRAPLPFRKIEPVFEVPPSGRTEDANSGRGDAPKERPAGWNHSAYESHPCRAARRASGCDRLGVSAGDS